MKILKLALPMIVVSLFYIASSSYFSSHADSKNDNMSMAFAGIAAAEVFQKVQ